MSLDAERFKEVLSHFPSGVVVVTAQTGDGPVGFTCQTFGSLSLEPLAVTFAAGREGRSWPRIKLAGAVGVNVLAEGDADLARRFATRGIDKFAGVDWTSAPAGSPWLAGALARLEGRIVSTTPFGDHDLVIVEISHAEVASGRPLVYYRRSYGSLAEQESAD